MIELYDATTFWVEAGIIAAFATAFIVFAVGLVSCSRMVGWGLWSFGKLLVYIFWAPPHRGQFDLEGGQSSKENLTTSQLQHWLKVRKIAASVSAHADAMGQAHISASRQIDVAQYNLRALTHQLTHLKAPTPERASAQLKPLAARPLVPIYVAPRPGLQKERRSSNSMAA